MDWFVPLTLILQAGLILGAIFHIAMEKPSAKKPRPRYLSYGLSLVVCAFASWEVSGNHAAVAGADLARLGAPLLLGMAIVMLLMAAREHRGLDGASQA
jgi:hypothetical protein